MKIKSKYVAACMMIIFLLAAPACSINQNTSIDETWKFAVLCDTRGSDQNSTYKSCINDTIVSSLAHAVVMDGCDLVLVPGDLVNGWWRNCCNNTNSKISYDVQFENWKTAMKPVYDAGIGVYAVRGNHEDGSSVYPPQPPYNTFPDADLKAAFIKAFGSTNTSNGPCGETNLTYSFSHKNAFFIGLDEYITPHRVNQYWLDQQLASNNKTHVFVFGHEPAFKVNHSDCLGAYPKDRDIFWESIVSAGCRVYFCGHDHFYNRAHIMHNSDDKIYQMLIGSCGAPFKQWRPPYNDRFVVGDYHNEKYCGYALVTVDGDIAWIEWKALQNGTWVTRDSFHIKSVAGASTKTSNTKVTLTYEGPQSVEIRAALDIFPANGS
jgi:hypothetical protein